MVNDNKQNIAIMTWINYYNYGTYLQATALERILSTKFNVKIIDTEIENNSLYYINGASEFIYKKLKNKLQDIFTKAESIEISNGQIKKFDAYKDKYLELTEKCFDITDLIKLNNQFDIFIAGSDQIWAPTCFNDYYFLNFVNSDKKKIAYAPSIGINKIENKYLLDVYNKYLSKFDALSFREKQSVDYIYNKLGIKAEYVLDPTLLFNSDGWNSILNLNTYNNEKYLVVYFLGQNEKYWQQTKALADKLNLSIKVIPTYQKDYNRGYQIVEAGPKEFVETIKNASYVCTDSFHGTAFSLIFNKQFSVFKRFKDNSENCQNSRIYNILDIINDYSPLENDDLNITNIDYKKVNSLIATEREKSLNYLFTSIEKPKSKGKFIITENCSGCGACKQICPKGAISIKLNDKGFYEANIDDKLCIRCKQCQKVCSCNTNNTISVNNANAYSYKANEEVLKKSSSGGFAFDISNLLSKKGYYVYGCVMQNNKVFHKLAEPNDEKTLQEFQGSKYLQSNFSLNLSKLLAVKGKKLVIGTPCQIAGLNNILQKTSNREDYLLVDLICHGVPSYNLWQKQLDYVKNTYKMYNPSVVFRDKTAGRFNKQMLFYDDTKQVAIKEKDNVFYDLFNGAYVNNESCYRCNYRDKSSADIRIGDYWGNFENDFTGISIVIPFTEKGKSIVDGLSLEKQSINDYLQFQQSKNHFKTIFYDSIIEDLKNKDISIKQIDKKYLTDIKDIQKISNVFYKIKQLIKG